MAHQQRRGSNGGGQQAQAALTFPILPWKEIIELLQAGLGVSLSAVEAQNPTSATMARISSAFIELITGVPRNEVGLAVNSALQNCEYPELFREALPQLVLYRELERVSEASLFEIKMDDLVSPTSARVQRFLSAVFNFGRFKEDVTRQHGEHSDNLIRIQEEINALVMKSNEFTMMIKSAKERQAKEAPERAQLEMEIQAEESALRALEAERASLESGVDEDKKKAEATRRKCDGIAFEIVTMQNQIEQLKLRLVNSPERVKGELAAEKRKMELEKEEVEKQQEEEREIENRLVTVKQAEKLVDSILSLLAEVEEQHANAKQAEEAERERKNAIESHGYRVKDLQHKEQEALKEIEIAEEKTKRLASQRMLKIEATKAELRQVMREKENLERNQNDAKQKNLKMKREEINLKEQIQKIKRDHEEATEARQHLFVDVLTSFDQFVKGIDEGVLKLKSITNQ